VPPVIARRVPGCFGTTSGALRALVRSAATTEYEIRVPGAWRTDRVPLGLDVLDGKSSRTVGPADQAYADAGTVGDHMCQPRSCC